MSKRKRERDAASLYINSLIARVSFEPLPEGIEDQMRGWERLTGNWSPTECDQCRRVAPADYDWLYSLVYAPFIDPVKARELEGTDKRMFVVWGRGVLWTLRQRCADCADDRPELEHGNAVRRADDATIERVEEERAAASGR